MQLIPGIIENGCVRPLQVIPAEDNTPVLVFILPKLKKNIEKKKEHSLFGKWTWFTDDMEGEIKNAWKSWQEKTVSL